MTQVNINFSGVGSVAIAGYNTLEDDPASIALLDAVGGSTGLTWTRTGEKMSSYNGTSNVDQDWHGVPEQAWNESYYLSKNIGDPSYVISGFSAGKAVSLSVAGLEANTARDVVFDVNGSQQTYVNTGAGAPVDPAEPLTFAAVADASGEIAIAITSTTYTHLTVVSLTYEAPVTGPTITGPDSTTEGAVAVQTGTLLDTVVTQSLISGAYSIAQTIDSATATTLNYVAESGVNQCTPSTPVAGVPLEPTITAAGITPYVVQQKADDGTNPPATRNITLNPEATHEVIQTMIGVANTNDDQSIFGSSYVTVEDNHQARLPKIVDGVTFTWNDKGEFTTDIDKTVTFQYELFSPASGNWSAISLTVKDTVIIDSGEKKRKNKRQSQVYQYYLNKNWKEKFQGSE